MHVVNSLTVVDVMMAIVNVDQALPRVEALAALAAQVHLDHLDHLVTAGVAVAENE